MANINQTYSLDTRKTRAQSILLGRTKEIGEASMAVSRSSMYKGLSVSLMRTSFQNMILFSIFEYTKSQINSLETWMVWWNEIIKLLNYWIWRDGRLRLRRFHLLLLAGNITQISMCNTILCTYENQTVLYCLLYELFVSFTFHIRRDRLDDARLISWVELD